MFKVYKIQVPPIHPL
jgi:hypothetical protein